MHKVAPSILSADFSNLRNDIEIIEDSVADWVHIDVMDGVFVPNISFGIPIIKAIRKFTKKPFDVHLMIVNPEQYFEVFKNAGADIISFHIEVCNHVHMAIKQIKKLGIKAGIAINPHTPISVLEEILPIIDLVCVMSVNPGFGGQKFIENTYNKIEKLRLLADELNPNLLIEIDGGINTKNSEKLINKGANVLVAGSSVFEALSPKNAINQLKTLKV